MILMLKNDGTLSIIEPTTLTVGSANTSDIILLSALGYSSYNLSVELPNGNILKNLVMSPLGAYPIANEAGIVSTINAFYYHVDGTWTKLPGILKITVYGVNNVGGVLASYPAQINVLGVVPTSLPAQPTAEVYNDILASLGALKSIYDALYAAYEQLSDDFEAGIEAHNVSPTAHANQLNVIRSSITALEQSVSTANTTAANAVTIANEAKAIAQHAQDTADAALHSERYIGMTSVSTLENIDTVLNNYVASKGYTLQRGDVVFVILSKPNETDVAYRYIYFGGSVGWNGYEIPTVEAAGNFSQGLVEGSWTENPAQGVEFMVNIVSGVIENIYIVNYESGVYAALPVILNEVAQQASTAYVDALGLLNGTKTAYNASHLGGKTEGQLNVATAVKATQDGNGNNIPDTYQTKSEGATKEFVKDYALPKVFGNVYYLKNTTELVDTAPVVESLYDGTVVTTNVTAGNNTIFSHLKYPTSNPEFTINKDMSITNRLWFAISNISVADVVTVTYNIYYVHNNTRTLVSTAQSNAISAANETKYKVDFENVFSLLGDVELTIDNVNTYLEYELVITSTIDGVFTLYSYASTYLSYSRLDILASSINVNYIGSPVEVTVLASDFTLDQSGDYKAVIPQSVHKQPASGKYFLTAYYTVASGQKYIAVDYVIDNLGNISLFYSQPITCKVLIACANAESDADTIAYLEEQVNTLNAVVFGSYVDTIEDDLKYVKSAKVPTSIVVEGRTYRPVANSRFLPVHFYGNSVCKNNKFDVSKFTTGYGITTDTTDNSFTFDFNVTNELGDQPLVALDSIPNEPGHVYLYRLKLVSGSVDNTNVQALVNQGYSINVFDEQQMDIMPMNAGEEYMSIVYINSFKSYLFTLSAQEGVVFSDAKFHLDWVDLTLMFGYGKEPTVITDNRISLIKEADLGHIDNEMENSVVSTVQSVESNGSTVKGTITLSSVAKVLRKADTTASEIVVAKGANGLYTVSLIENVLTRQLSTFDWSIENGYFLASNVLSSLAVLPTADTVKGDIFVNGYVTAKASEITAATRDNLTVGISASGSILIADSKALAEMTAVEFKASLANVYINFKAPNPVTTVLGSNLDYTDVTTLLASLGYIAVPSSNAVAYPDVDVQFVCR